MWLDSVAASSLSLLSDRVGAPVFVFRGSDLVRTFGKVPYFQEVLSRRDMPVTPDGNMVRQCVFPRTSEGGFVFLMGPFRSGQGFSDDELSDAFDALPVYNPKFDVLLESAVGIVARCAARERDDFVKIRSQSLVLDFVHHVGHPRDSALLLKKAVDFFANKFNISNAVVYALNSRHRFFDNNARVYEPVESLLLASLKDSRSVIRIDDIRSDFLFKNVEGLKYLPSSLVAYPLVHDRDFLGALVLFSDELSDLEFVPGLVKELVHMILGAGDYERVRTSARVDALTGLYNRNFFVPSVTKLIADLHASSSPVTVILFDVDNFKKFNDTFGHPKGDIVLKTLGDICLDVAPEAALCCRYGGEEFAIVLPSDQHYAAEFAERLRARVERDCDLTISIGVITCLNSSASFSDLIREADRALYKAKHLGKNRVVPFIMVDKSLGVVDTTSV